MAKKQKSNLSFLEWLRTQVDGYDAISDLARDVFADQDNPASGDSELLRKGLAKHSTSSLIREILAKAEEQYRRYLEQE